MNKKILLPFIFVAFASHALAGDENVKKISEYLIQLSKEKSFSGGLLIMKNGEKVFSGGYGYADKEKNILFDQSTLASMGSITKAFTAAGIMKLCEQKKLSVSDKLKKFFPDIPADKANITIHQLLTHSSGFHEFLKDDRGDYEKIETKQFLEKAFAEPLLFKPGEKAVYTNVGMSILGIIIEQVSGMDYEKFLQQYLFKPAMVNIGYHYPAPAGEVIAVGYENGKRWGTHQEHFDAEGGGPYWNLKANGGLEASLDDVFAYVNSLNRHALMADTFVQMMYTPYVDEDGTNGLYKFGYGCNIAKSRRNTTVIENGGSNGIYFARLVRYPEEGLVFYMVTNESTIGTDKVLPNVMQLYFDGKITRDALNEKPQFESPMAENIYNILVTKKPTDLTGELNKANISVGNDMILLEVGQKLMNENKTDEALTLYTFYTKQFPNIVVAWNDLGDVYRMKNNKEEARKCYEQALTIRPNNQRAKDNLEKLKQ
jgi:CubicO group peptidase (beta-lactamase class C family)